MIKPKRIIPDLNTTALPDLIFTVLFFFMIVTHMRDNRTDMPIKTPDGTNLQKIERRYATTNLYIGMKETGEAQIQINGKAVAANQITKSILAEIGKISDEERPRYTVCIKADRDTPLHVISHVKSCLQQADVRNVTFIAHSKDKNSKK